MSKSKKPSSYPDPKTGPNPPSKKRDRSSLYRHLTAVGLFAGVAFVIYSNTFSVPFLFDDRPNITQNPNIQIKVLTWERIEALIQYTYRESIRVFAYLTFALNFGNKTFIFIEIISSTVNLLTGENLSGT